MDEANSERRSRGRRAAGVRHKPPLKVVSDIDRRTPVTAAEVDLVVAMLGRPDGVRRILAGCDIAQADSARLLAPLMPSSLKTPTMLHPSRPAASCKGCNWFSRDPCPPDRFAGRATVAEHRPPPAPAGVGYLDAIGPDAVRDAVGVQRVRTGDDPRLGLGRFGSRSLHRQTAWATTGLTHEDRRSARALDEGRGVRETARLLKMSAAKVSEIKRMAWGDTELHPRSFDKLF